MALANSNINPGTACTVDVDGCFVMVAGGYLTDNGHQTPTIFTRGCCSEVGSRNVARVPRTCIEYNPDQSLVPTSTHALQTWLVHTIPSFSLPAVVPQVRHKQLQHNAKQHQHQSHGAQPHHFPRDRHHDRHLLLSPGRLNCFQFSFNQCNRVISYRITIPSTPTCFQASSKVDSPT